MKALTLLAVLLAALAATACRKPVKAEAPPDWNKTRANAERSHGSLDKETGD